jgi:hypothetical protein
MADDDKTLRFTIDGKAYSVDFDDLELGEVEIIEEACDAPLALIDFRRVKAIRGVVFMLMRRDDPDVTMAEVASIKLSAITDTPDGDAAKRPTKPAAKTAASD